MKRNRQEEAIAMEESTMIAICWKEYDRANGSIYYTGRICKEKAAESFIGRLYMRGFVFEWSYIHENNPEDIMSDLMRKLQKGLK